jgi:hypothetical protein
LGAERMHLHRRELETKVKIILQKKNPNLSLCGSVCVSADGRCGREDVGLRVQLCKLKGETQASLKMKKSKTTCPVVFSYLRLVDMIIMMLEYRKTGIQEVQIRPVLQSSSVIFV